MTVSSAGEPKTLIVPGSLYLSMASLTAIAAAAAAVPMALCPQPWPGAPATIGSCFGTRPFWESVGRASNSPRMPMTGFPEP